MAAPKTIAQAIMDGDERALDRVAAGLLKPLAWNFVERPWGGMRIRAYKGLCPLPDQARLTGSGLGEAFEIAAYDADEEARAYPSRLRFEDGSELALPALLRRHADVLLGPALARAHGGAFPLLPKTLDVKELLSVQGHPAGHTEVYVVIEADPGATIRVGFNDDVDPERLEQELRAGRARQQRLLETIGTRLSTARLQTLLAPWLAAREAGLADLPDELRDVLGGAGWSAAAELLERLKDVYWWVLDRMNEIPVAAGTIVHNASPARVVAPGGVPSAEVHALGNPEGREILALEIRRPGPTFRAWDNVRFPLRRIDIDTAIAGLNLRRVAPEELLARRVLDRAGVYRSVADPSFALEHLCPSPGTPAVVPAEAAHTLHAIAGRVDVLNEEGRLLGSLARGESALVPAGVGAYRVASDDDGAEVVKVTLDGAR
ncbi:MAG TPA: hypothetical protein VF329_12240 [Gammaproteobacteria bacterium]